MSNKTRGVVRMQADDGTEYKLQFTMNALCLLEDQVGMGVLEWAKPMLESVSEADKLKWATFSNYRLLTWAALVENGGDDLTLKDAGQILHDCGGIEVVQEKVMEAFLAAFPASAEKAAAQSAAGNAPAAGSISKSSPRHGSKRGKTTNRSGG